MTPLENFVGRLDRVTDRGNGQYFASCPGPLHEHGDRNPSLSIKECDDHTLLLKCFAGCGATDVVAAVGLELRDLFPESGIEPRKGKRPRWNYRDLLFIARHEVTVVAVAVADLTAGRAISDADVQRIYQARDRLQRIAEVADGC